MTLSLSTTGYSEASTCLKRYYYHFVEHLVPKPIDLPPRMRFGIWAHRCLQDYHSGKDPVGSLQKMVAWIVERGGDEEKAKAVALDVADLIDQYSSYWGGDPKAEWESLTEEEEFSLTLPKADVTLRATVDAVVKDHRGIWIVEHKTTSDIPEASWRGVDPQTAIQYLLVSRSRRYPTVEGITFNYLLTKIPSVPQVVGMKEKAGPRFAANSAITTSTAFEKGWRELYSVWKGNFGESQAYHDEWYKKLVSDGLWFQRYDVLRPTEHVLETMRDVAETVKAIRRAEETGHWRRSFHIMTCGRFCMYGELCMQEYLNGKPSQAMREGLFAHDDGKREGRDL